MKTPYKYLREEAIVEEGYKITIPRSIMNYLKIKVGNILILESMPDGKIYLSKKS